MALSFIQTEKKILDGDDSGSCDLFAQAVLYNFRKTDSPSLRGLLIVY
jgi:hypothetical protein